MNTVARAGSFLLLGFLLAPLNLPADTVVLTNTTVRVMAANLNGNSQVYAPFALHIFQGLKPDIVAIQEFNYFSTNGVDQNNASAFREMVDIAFGTNFVYFRENYTASGDLPNGIISRYPIVASGSWTDPYVSNRGFAWAQVDLPGTNSLYVVSVHLLTSSSGARASEAAALKPLIQANFPNDAWVVLAGDFNTDTRSEAAMVTFDSFLSDSPVPADQQGNSNTSINRNHPHDYVLPSFSFTSFMTASVFPSSTFPSGLVFDSRVYTPLSDVAPVQSADSGLAQHMAVLKDFLIPYTITNAPTDMPSIVTQPQSQTQEPGNSATFTVVASGAPTLTYQWRFGTSNIASATASSLILTNVQSGNAGSYAVVITNAAGTLTSSIATLTVGTAPVITTQPQGQSVSTGATVGFSVTATGTLPIAYQWRLNGTNIGGATTNSYVISSVQTNDVGSYSVLVTNIAGSATSSNASLTLNALPAITSQPQSQTVAPGQNAHFTVSATGAAPLYYQWRCNGTNLAGATTTGYTRTNAQTSDAGSYSVVITNAAGTITSADAVLSVGVLPSVLIAQWNFNSNPADGVTTTGTTVPSVGAGTASLIGGTSQTFAGGSTTDPAPTADNSGWNTSTYPASSAGNKTAGVKFVVSTAGKQDITIRWDQKESNTGSKYVRLRYTTNGTDFIDFPTAVSVSSTIFEPKTNSLAGFPGVNNNSNFAFQIVAEFESTAMGTGGTNYVGANGTYGTGGTVRFDMVTVSGTAIPIGTPPNITSQPANQTANQGANVTFSVLATGTDLLSYQWRFNSSPLSGATASNYTRTNVQPANMGTYSVVVTNGAGTATSSNATLSLVVSRPILVMQSPQVIQWQGLSNLAYTVQARTNLNQTNWSTTGSASSPTANVAFTNQADAAQRFYRVVYP